MSKKPVPTVRQALKRERQVTVEYTVDEDDRRPAKRWYVTVSDYLDTTGGMAKPTDVDVSVYTLDGNGRALIPPGNTKIVSIPIQDWPALREGVDRAIEEFRKAYQGADHG